MGGSTVDIYVLAALLGGIWVLGVLSELGKMMVHKLFGKPEPIQITAPCSPCVQIRQARDAERKRDREDLNKEIEGLKEIIHAQNKKIDALVRLLFKMAIKMGVDDLNEDMREIL